MNEMQTIFYDHFEKPVFSIFSPVFHLKVHKRKNFLGFDFEICTFS
jgi:hypothetical protein